MNPAVRVALLGFTPFERSHIEAGLLPGDEPGHRYCVTQSLHACSLVVVNADDESAVQLVVDQGRLRSAVMLGTTEQPGAAAQLRRPISLVHLLRELDRLVDRAPAMSAAVQRVQDDWARMLGQTTPQTSAQPTGSATAAIPLIQGRSPSPVHQPVPARQAQAQQALIVDNNEEVWRFMSAHLLRLGFSVHQARDCHQALARLNRDPFALVLLAAGLEGVDSFHTCRTIKRATLPAHGCRPRVVMLLGPSAAVDAVRAQTAGADACLHRPLNAALLTRVLEGWHLSAPSQSSAQPRPLVAPEQNSANTLPS